MINKKINAYIVVATLLPFYDPIHTDRHKRIDATSSMTLLHLQHVRIMILSADKFDHLKISLYLKNLQKIQLKITVSFTKEILKFVQQIEYLCTARVELFKRTRFYYNH